MLQESVWEARTESCSINVDLSCLGHVDFLAAGTEVLEARSLERITHTDWQDLLAVAQSSWTSAEDTAQEFLIDFGQATWGENVTRMDHAIQIRCLLVELEECFIVEVIVVGLLWGKDHSDAALELVFGELFVEALEIERVADEFIVDLAEELVSFQSAEPLDPTNLRVLVVWIV